jgi:hypothetical protein
MSNANLPTKSDTPAMFQPQTIPLQRNSYLKVSDSAANPAPLTGSDENLMSSQEEMEKHNSWLVVRKENEANKESAEEVDRECMHGSVSIHYALQIQSLMVVNLKPYAMRT